MTDKISNYPGNRKTDRNGAPEKPVYGTPEDKPKPAQITQAIQKKKSVGRRIIESFTGDDAQSVGSYLLFDVFIPAAKNFIMDAASQGVERILFGESRRSSSSSRLGYTSYNNYSRPAVTTRSSYSGIRDEPRQMNHLARATHNFDDIVLPNRGDAELVLDQLRDQITKYDVATVSDLYNLVGLSGEFTDDKWGWGDLRDAGVVYKRQGYLLDLPRPELLD